MGMNTITDMEVSIPCVDRVTNPYPAIGGTDAETLEEAVLRAPWELKHGQRAVTSEDFEQFALEANGEVARVHVHTDDQGIVNIMIIPHDREQDRGKPEATPELCREVEQYIDRHRLITTRIHVFGPTYVHFTLHAEVVLLPGYSNQTQQKKQEIVDAVRDFFHPLTGEMRGTGWEMGRSVHISELYYIIENVTGVDYVSQLMLNNQPGTQKIKIHANEFPYPEVITIKFVSE
jgi:predicted phage baseplate assembly protein